MGGGFLKTRKELVTKEFPILVLEITRYFLSSAAMVRKEPFFLYFS